jgi:hypothetical protein
MIFRNNPFEPRPPTSSAAYPGAQREDVVLDKKQLGAENDGPLWVKTFRFKKEKTFRDMSGTAVVKIPMTETLFLITKYKTAMWLNAKELESLAGMIEGQKKLSALGGGYRD